MPNSPASGSLRASWRLRLLLAAALSGAAGLGLESLGLSVLGLSMGQGRATLWGLGVWLAAWALAARASGRLQASPQGLLWRLAGASVVLYPGCVVLLLALGRGQLSAVLGAALALTTLAIPAALQGALLPQLFRLHGQGKRGDEAAWLLGANLAGGVVGVLWIADRGVGLAGRPVAAGLAGLAAGAAALLALSTSAATPALAPEAKPDPGVRRAGLAWALLTGWMVAAQWSVLRVAAVSLGGQQPALTAVLMGAPLALALGAGPLAMLLGRARAGLSIALLLAGIGTWLCTRAGFIGLTESVAKQSGAFAGASLLALPVMAPLGAALPLLHRRLVGDRGRRLGDLLGWEALGALAFIPLVHLVLMPAAGLPLVLALGPALGALAALVLRAGPGLERLALAVALSSLAALIARAPSPVLATRALSRPDFELLAFQEDANFAVAVVEDRLRGERTLLTDDFRATATGDDYLYMQALGHLPLLLHAAPKRVGVLAFGTGTTAGAVARHKDVQRIDIFELSAAVIAFAGEFENVNGGVLRDPRTRVHLGDGRRQLRNFEGALDVLSMEPLLPDSPFAVYLYTPAFYAIARSALAPGGIMCQWVPPHALRPETFEAVLAAFSQAFPWSSVFLFGSQVILIGGEQQPALSALRIPSTGAAAVALRNLGLVDPAGIAARYVTGAWPAVERPLTDADPWVLFAPKAPGREIIQWLPNNLASLRARESDPPAGWELAHTQAARERRAGVRALHRAREAFERERFRLPQVAGLQAFRTHAAEAARSLSGDPEWLHLARTAAFESARQEGLLLLRSGSWKGAMERLLSAAEIRPERADIHLYVALAADGLRDTQAALGALRHSLRLCPGLLETAPGQVATQIGFSKSLAAALAQLQSK
ncbi:MAG: spermidine synthase [Planctomycetota bacterium]